VPDDNPYIRPGVRPKTKPKARAYEGVKDWVAGKLDSAKEVVRPNQSASYRKFRAKELLGLDKNPEQTPQRRAQAKSLFKR
jgi:hypothetical protein